MHALNRWWQKNQWIVILGGISLLAAAGLRALGLLPLREVYRAVSQPFQPDISQQQANLDAETVAQRIRIRELEEKNVQLAEMLKQPKVKTGEAIASAVIARSADHWWQHALLNQGTQAGVVTDAVVEAPGGLVGRIVQVTPHSSQVLLLSDPESRLAVVLSRSRSVGILQGDRSQGGILEFFDQDSDVKPGDAIVTSALSCFFPGGIPVGLVKSIARTDKQTLKAQVKFTVPLDRLEWVSVYHYEKTQKNTPETSACP